MKVLIILHIQWNHNRMGVAYNEDFTGATETIQTVECLIITFVENIRQKGGFLALLS
jgi:hypothetical protein